MAQTPPKSPSAVPPDVPSVADPARENNRARFELELEFVQALANPFYLHSLAQQGVLHQPAFINYLAYLLYWKEKDYARFIQCVPPPPTYLHPRASPFSPFLPVHISILRLTKSIATCPRRRYPHALHHLELLQNAQFRAEVGKDDLRQALNQKQFDHWRTW
ncbi:SOH1-domain-containing protein [Amylostereum chailletii]|nr:SOH1-domain-containing protein [Amylostereum chailletii]